MTLYGDNATLFSQNHQGEICATFHLNSNDPNATVPITLRSSVITVAGDPTNQTLLETVTGSVTTTLDAAHTTATLCIEVDDILCSQVDAYAGVPPTGVPTADNILAGAVFHPSFDSSGVETFTVDAVDLGNPDVQAHVANECKSANIGNVGLTIGFWKNHYANWQGYTPDTTLGSIFAGLDDSSYAPGLNPYSSLQNLTFAQALSLSGGPGLSDQAGLMVKQAVGALLNASNDQVGYPLTTGQIKVAINNALASENATTMGTLQGLYDTYNNVDISSITNPINNSKKN